MTRSRAARAPGIRSRVTSQRRAMLDSWFQHGVLPVSTQTASERRCGIVHAVRSSRLFAHCRLGDVRFLVYKHTILVYTQNHDSHDITTSRPTTLLEPDTRVRIGAVVLLVGPRQSSRWSRRAGNASAGHPGRKRVVMPQWRRRLVVERGEYDHEITSRLP